MFLLDYANDRDTETNKSDGHTVNMESTACPSFFRGGVAGGNGKDPRGYLDFDTRPAKSSTRRELMRAQTLLCHILDREPPLWPGLDV